MKLYFIQEHLERKVYHGGIGNVDAEKIFLQKGFKAVLFPYHYDFSLKAKLGRLWYLLKMFITLPAGCYVIFQFPLYARMSKLLIAALKYRRSVRIICLVMDIDGIKDGNDVLLEKEIAELNGYNYFIVHNSAMKQWLLSKTNPVQVSCIDFFDFLTVPVRTTREKSFEVAFAGNLDKSGFLGKLGLLNEHSPQLIFNIYGKNPAAAITAQANVWYKGFTEPYLMPGMLQGSFGLVWDGGLLENPTDVYGNYMRFISHHKLSLYIVSGMPVIVWKEGAAAAIVDHYKIGIAVNSLYELENAISIVSEASYQQMASNARNLASSISRGERLGNAIDELLTAKRF